MMSDSESDPFEPARTGVIARRGARIARALRRLSRARGREAIRAVDMCAAITRAQTPVAIAEILETDLPAIVPCERVALELHDGFGLMPAGTPLSTRAGDVLTLPLRSGNVVSGVMRAAGTFSGHDRDFLELLAGLIGTAVVTRRHLQQLEATITYLEQRNSELDALSTADALTGIANRRAFDCALGNEWRRLTRSGGTLSLLLIDIDHFKDFNDGHGHLAGDECLRLVATLLAATVRRAGDFVARTGGEEFGVILPDTPADAAERLANDLCARVRFEGFSHPGSPVSAHLTVSVGVASARPGPGSSPSELYAEADAALYRAKRAGRDVVSR